MGAMDECKKIVEKHLDAIEEVEALQPSVRFGLIKVEQFQPVKIRIGPQLITGVVIGIIDQFITLLDERGQLVTVRLYKISMVTPITCAEFKSLYKKHKSKSRR